MKYVILIGLLILSGCNIEQKGTNGRDLFIEHGVSTSVDAYVVVNNSTIPKGSKLFAFEFYEDQITWIFFNGECQYGNCHDYLDLSYKSKDVMK